MGALTLREGDRVIVRPEVAVYVAGLPVVRNAGTVLEVRNASTRAAVVRVDCPGLDARAWYSSSLFKLADEAK